MSVTENTPLSKSKALWAIFIIGSILSALSAIIVYWFAQESFTCEEINAFQCLMLFKDLSYIPMAFLTATITTAGFWSLIFRSDQTSRQIRITTEHNSFNNYLSHKKAFTEALERFEVNHNCRVIDKQWLHHSFFPNLTMSVSDFTFDNGFLIIQLRKIQNSNRMFNSVTKDTDLEEFVKLIEGQLYLIKLESSLVFEKLIKLKLAGSYEIPSDFMSVNSTPEKLYSEIYKFSQGSERFMNIMSEIRQGQSEDVILKLFELKEGLNQLINETETEIHKNKLGPQRF